MSVFKSTVISEEELGEEIEGWEKVKKDMLKQVYKTLNCCKSEIMQRDECF